MKPVMILSLLIALQAKANVFSPIQQGQIPVGDQPKVVQPQIENPELFKGKVVAILASHGVEESEITFPYNYLVQRGAQVEILVPNWSANGVTATRFLAPSLFVKATRTFQQARGRSYDLLVLTGGAWNAQVVRTDEDALAIVRSQHLQNRPIAAICAGTSILINAGLTRNLIMTGSPVVKLDLQNSGAKFQDSAVVISQKIVTSRTPDDLEAFVFGIKQVLTAQTR